MPATGPINSIPVSSLTGSNNTLVAAVTGKKIRIRAMVLSLAGSAGTVTFHDNAGSPVTLMGPLPISLTAALVLPDNPEGWGDTTVSQALQVDASVGTLNGMISYQVIN